MNTPVPEPSSPEDSAPCVVPDEATRPVDGTLEQALQYEILRQQTRTDPER